MTIFEKLRKMPVDKKATFIFESAINPCMFCAQGNNECPNTIMVQNPDVVVTDWNEYQKAKQICVDQITVGLLQEA